MMLGAPPTVSARDRPTFAPSWVDYATAKIERFPGNPLVFYLISLLAVTLAYHVAFWLDGAVPTGSFRLVLAGNGLYVVLWLALYHHLTKVASRSLEVFRPLLAESNQETAWIDYRLSTLPRRIGWLTLPFGLLFGLSELLPGTNPFGDLVPKTPLPLVLDVLATIFLASTFFCLIIRSVRQLRTVRNLHRQAVDINLLKLEPAHAFSLLTSRTGMGVILPFLLGYLLLPSAFQTALNIISALIIGAIAVAVFVLPIIGIRGKIEEEKQRSLDAISDLLQSAQNDLHDKVRRRAYKEFEGIEQTIDALIQERQLISSVPTWPWHPTTVRGFASALLLPLVLWLITRLLERIL